ncbi:MAG: DegV family protein, partial [Clostridiales bacterium]|nr:DegV family protein [Clostridiales bacterium]
MKYRIVADSSSNILHRKKHVTDISSEQVDLDVANKSVTMEKQEASGGNLDEQQMIQDYVSVPLKIITKEKEYTDTKGLDVEAMVVEMQQYQGKSSTSCPNIADWLDAFEGADRIFVVSITSNLSGGYDAALQARKEYIKEHPQAKVAVLDTLSTGPEMQLIIEKLEEVIHQEKSFEVMEKEIRAYMNQTHLLFTLSSLKNLVNNGRVNPAVAAVAGLLGIRIVGKASDEGTLETLHKCRKEKQLYRIILDEIKKAVFSGGNVRISH